MHSIARHTAAAAATAVVVAVLPGIAAELSWRIEDLLGQSGGVSFYVRGWRSSETTVTNLGDLINPFSPGPLILLFVLLVCSLVGEQVAAKRQWLRWAYPAVPAIVVATVVAVGIAVVLPPDLPRTVPLVVWGSAFVSIGALAILHWCLLRMLA